MFYDSFFVGNAIEQPRELGLGRWNDRLTFRASFFCQGLRSTCILVCESFTDLAGVPSCFFFFSLSL